MTNDITKKKIPKAKAAMLQAPHTVPSILTIVWKTLTSSHSWIIKNLDLGSCRLGSPVVVGGLDKSPSLNPHPSKPKAAHRTLLCTSFSGSPRMQDGRPQWIF